MIPWLTHSHFFRETQSEDLEAEVGGSGLSSTDVFLGGSRVLTVNAPLCLLEGKSTEDSQGFMESGERKRNEDNKAAVARIGWGGIRKMDLEITGQEDAAA